MKLDDVIIAIVNSIDDFNIAGKVVLPNTEVKKSRYHLIMHELNHNTHHRGEISALLNQMGYDNDYSNLITIVWFEYYPPNKKELFGGFLLLKKT